MTKPSPVLPPTSEITPVFTVPFAQALHPQATALNAELHALLLTREGDPR